MDSDDTWTLATGEDDGKPLVVRIRNQPPSFARKESFPQLLAVSWHYEPDDDRGMPSHDVVERMGQFEEMLMSAFEDACQAFLTVTVTGNGARAWQCYARNADEAMELVNEALGAYDPFPVEFNFQNDPEWEGYARFREITC